jgi:GNAT superfamily N-acetyltransferase
VSIGFGGAWPFEIERAATRTPCGLFVAERDGRIAAFAAHDGNNRGLGWFGPAGTWPEHRGQGLGEALLIACLVDVAAHQARSEIAWIGPREFYTRALGPLATRKFAVLTRDAPAPPRDAAAGDARARLRRAPATCPARRGGARWPP